MNEVKCATMRWCDNDYHDKKIWYDQGTLLNIVELTPVMKNGLEEKPRSSDTTRYSISNNFKITLAAMT